MVEFPELVRFDADVTPYLQAGAWSDVFPRTPNGTDGNDQPLFNSSHQGAHAVGRDLTNTIAVYGRINDIYDEAGMPRFAGADDTSNGALLPTSVKGGINGRIAVHRGQQTADFDAIMHDKNGSVAQIV